MENESIAGTIVEEIATTGKRKNRRGDSSKMIPCPKCGKLCRGQIGLETHDDWAHNEAKRAKRMKAAKRVAKARILRNRGMIIPPKLTRSAKKDRRADMEARRVAQRNWYHKNKARLKARTRKHEVEMEVPASVNGDQPLQRAATPRLLQFWRELEAVEQALAYVQNQ
jgi:hypothetical protein